MNRTPDLIEAARAQWRDVHPDLDTSSMEVIGRVLRAAAVLRHRLDAVLAEEGLNRAEFDLLCALRRTGAPVSPGKLNELTVASGAAVTKRIQALAERGLLERATDERDRRRARVQLTRAGEELTDRALARNLAAEQRVLAGLTARQREAIATGLAHLLRSLEGAPDVGLAETAE
ncbi:MarR family winged helix-turn-helix transcriptional regulator [Saccharopolyspora rectivirgula]|jgi:DNA-binding MarR family transcriptional regulator|uniref:MarR family transcriptional regulator n=1 Tax=Saccharopolyspora rectivirgula TaxID=28042 RepID=A0A073B0K5_9PSEU|nr:MarR family transcriptional regulator [Saccharopolyspora rectivirgula]KEI44827.1 MarR family transcriptional regulator [Saccharopolyspora rectivirgula]